MPSIRTLWATLALAAATSSFAYANTPQLVAQATPPDSVLKGELPAKSPTKAVRDPFVNLTESKLDRPVVPRPVPPSGHNQRQDVTKPQVALTQPTTEDMPVPPPSVDLHGVITSSTGNQAIVSSKAQTYMIRPGDKLGDYKVTSIEAQKVTFSFKDKSFVIKMHDEFTAMNTVHGRKK